ncbi:type II toxin-antitoxin system HicB family antitoxin [Endozoicomonas sp. 4G]|uniref:type II toxin-antitoxin system HicB family antitoxin n=1 Tax=Endozoicomonas sp. 4G TaxID=2872754 RepID=UPI0020791B77|nr:type II toxin-antitoxin system HicB family antitoxin [Endozoicomonas sp. 4G]
MKYPIAIEWGDDEHATGIAIPDIPGAITAGDTYEEAYKGAVEVAHIMLEEMVGNGEEVPLPSPVKDLMVNPDYEGWGWGLIEVDLSPYLGKTEKINVTLPGVLVNKIDSYVKSHDVKSRSAFLADAAMEKLRL